MKEEKQTLSVELYLSDVKAARSGVRRGMIIMFIVFVIISAFTMALFSLSGNIIFFIFFTLYVFCAAGALFIAVLTSVKLRADRFEIVTDEVKYALGLEEPTFHDYPYSDMKFSYYIGPGILRAIYPVLPFNTKPSGSQRFPVIYFKEYGGYQALCREEAENVASAKYGDSFYLVIRKGKKTGICAIYSANEYKLG